MIAAFYENCEIFITGGSGVVGKSAIEKLLRSCNVKRIYMLLRSKKGFSPDDRLEEVKKSRIFNVLKKLKPNELDKLVAIPGNLELDSLGISAEHKEMMKNVSIVFHSGASTRFVEPLKRAICLNVKSTLEAMKLAEKFEKLKIFIHISTFYSNPYLDYIENKIYPAAFDWKAALKLLEDDTNEIAINTITNKVIDGFTNTYLFTKHLAEQMVNDYRFKLPVGIYRPSVVIGAFLEPEPGFSETKTGVMGVFVLWGAGLLHVLKGRGEINFDMTPLDVGTKVLLAFAVQSAQLSREKMEEAIPVTLFSSRRNFIFNFGEQVKSFQMALDKNPFLKSVWLPSFYLTTSPFLYWFLTIILQVLPSLVFDALLKLFGQKPFLMKIQRKAFNSVQFLEFFLNKEYESGGVTQLDDLVEMLEGTEFCLKEAVISCQGVENTHKTIETISLGCRTYLMNEDSSSLPQSRRIHKYKKIAYNILRGYVLYVVGRALLRRVVAYLEEAAPLDQI